MSTTNGLGPGACGLSSAASLSTPSALLYFTISGVTSAIEFHFSLNRVTVRAVPPAGFSQSSGA